MYRNKILKNIEVSLIRQIALKMKDYADGIDLTIGEPSQDLPESVKQEMSNRVLNYKIGYTQTGGMPELKEEVVNYYNKQFESDYTVENCLITVGSTEGLSTFIRYFVQKDDEVLMPIPTYPGYAPNIKMQEGKEVYIDTSKNNYKLTAQMLEKYITPKTKALILTYPNNPSGSVLELDEMDKIAEVIRKNNIYVLSDEIYGAIAFEKYNSFARYKDLKDKIIVINGFSKSHSMTGYRIGYMLASKTLISDFIKLSQYTTTGVSTVGQYGAIKALQDYPTRENVILENKNRLEFFVNGLEKLGFDVIKPEGAFYIFAGYSKLSDMNSLDFTNYIVEKTHVGVVPGLCFMVDKYLRFSVTKDIPVLEQVLKRIEKALKELKN